MQIQITGKNIKIGKALPQHITGELKSLVKKYFKDATNAHVVVEKNGLIFKAEVQVEVNDYVGGIISSAEAGDAYSAFGDALIHAAKIMRRKKRQFIDKHRVHHYEKTIKMV